jgi:hypothetical protein
VSDPAVDGLSTAAREVLEASANPMHTQRVVFGRVWTIVAMRAEETLQVGHNSPKGFEAKVWIDNATGIMSWQPQLTALWLGEVEEAINESRNRR